MGLPGTCHRLCLAGISISPQLRELSQDIINSRRKEAKPAGEKQEDSLDDWVAQNPKKPVVLGMERNRGCFRSQQRKRHRKVCGVVLCNSTLMCGSSQAQARSLMAERSVKLSLNFETLVCPYHAEWSTIFLLSVSPYFFPGHSGVWQISVGLGNGLCWAVTTCL